MEIKVICSYCDHTIYKTVYDQSSLKDLKCEKCKDKNLFFKDVAKYKIDGYLGCPPFPEKGNKAPFWRWNG